VFALDRSAVRVEQGATLAAVSDPLASLCASDASVRARVGAACDTAATASAAARTEGIPGRAGLDGQDGRTGQAGRDGRDGRDGITPPCMSTPTQCQGAAGTNGADGAAGADGQAGRDGQNGRDGQPCESPRVMANVTYASGQTGTGCVDPPPSEG
jgi:hypothetical protein